MKTLCYGAVLWDVIGSTEKLGGAPFNVAAHLARLGCDSYMVSRIGSDDRGDRIINEMQRLGVRNDFVQHDTLYETGVAECTVDPAGVATYSFPPTSAYQFISLDNQQIENIRTGHFNLMCFGCFEQKFQQTRETLYEILDSCTFDEIIFDVNIRQDFYPKDVIERSLQYATSIKLNDEEALRLSLLLFGHELDNKYFADSIRARYHTRIVCITKGAEGCEVYEGDSVISIPAVSIHVNDTIGSGDAFCAAFAYALLSGFDLATAAKRANRLGGFVASREGALPEYDPSIFLHDNHLFETSARYSLFYKPESGWLGDPMTYYENGYHYIYYLYSLQDESIGVHPVNLIRTRGFGEYEKCCTVLNPTHKLDAQDRCIGTGSIIYREGIYYLFYTAHNQTFREQNRPRQMIWLATSDRVDGSFVTVPEFQLLPPEEYHQQEWRDAYVYFDPDAGRYRMLISAHRKHDDISTGGLIVQYESDDLLNWSHMGILLERDDCYVCECPQIIKIGAWWYFIYSEFLLNHFVVPGSEFKGPTHYLVSRSPGGPWTIPEDDVLDGRGLNATKLSAGEDGAYVFGWIPKRDEYENDTNWGWGGNSVAHRLIQSDDGTLLTAPPEQIENLFYKNTPEIKTQEACFSDLGFFRVTDAASFSYMLTFKITFNKQESQACVLLGPEEKRLRISFSIPEGRLRLDPVENSSAPHCFRSYAFSPGHEYSVKTFVEGSVLVCYVDDKVAMSARIYGMTGNSIDLSGFDTAFTFVRLSVRES